MFNDNKYKLNTSKGVGKKPKKEKSFGKKTDGGGLSGGKRFGKDSGKVSLGTPKSGGNGENRFGWLKWWHILLAVIALVAIIVGVVLVTGLGSGSNTPGGSGNGNGELPPDPETIGTATVIGTFTPDTAGEYVLCEYTEYFSGETLIVAQKESDMRHGYNAYWVFINAEGKPSNTYRGELGTAAPETVKQQMLDMMSNAAGYTPEILAKCDVHVYQPVSFTKVKLSEVTLTEDNTVTLKFSAGAVDGELSEEYTLEGTYVKDGTAFTFTYSDLPEDELLLAVAEKLLTSAKYESYIMYGEWVNELTFGDAYKLHLRTTE